MSASLGPQLNQEGQDPTQALFLLAAETSSVFFVLPPPAYASRSLSNTTGAWGLRSWDTSLRPQGGLTLMLGSAAFAMLPAAVVPPCESSPPQAETRGHAPPGAFGSQEWQAWRREAESPHRVRGLEQGLIFLGLQVRGGPA